MNIPPIYKVKQIVNGSITTIYVFNGEPNIKHTNNDLFKTIFTDEENEQIKTDNISIKFSEQQIHFDDSIGTIKIKILKELKQPISIDELYLFYKKEEILNAVSIYKSLTQNKKLQLTEVRLEQFMLNIPVEMPESADIYTFDDIYDMKLDEKPIIINKTLGQKQVIIDNEYPFVCDPYDMRNYDKVYEKTTRKSLSTLNNYLLLNSGTIIDNSIYLCTAENVVSYLNKRDIPEEIVIKIYYPFLYEKNINSLEDLKENKSKLIESNKGFINDKTSDIFKTIDMFYNVYNEKKTELNYLHKGINFITAIIKPEFDIKIPLEIIFKVVHATQQNPLIKFNPSSRQENVYRLYTDKTAIDGRKIPYLKKGTIFKLIKSIGRTKTVAIYIETIASQTIICEFDEDGFILISAEFKTVVSIDEIDTIFKNTINPIIVEIANLLEQSGYKLHLFNSLTDENVEIKQLTYETQIQLSKPFNIELYKGCISSIFINETDTFKGKQINLRFKRVANYSNFTSQEAFILEKSIQGLRGDQIIEALLDNFKGELDRTQAIEMVTKIANELEVERGVRNTDIKIKNSPGFKTVITIDQPSGIITCITENINNINYLHTLPIYLDTIIRLTQDKTSTHYSLKNINKLCSTGIKEDIIIPKATEVSSVKDVDVQYKPIGPKGALSLFFNEDESIDEDEDEFEGGKGLIDSTPSGESISSEEEEKSISSIPSIPSISTIEEPLVKEDTDKSISSIPSISTIEEPLIEESSKDKSISSIPSISTIEKPLIEESSKDKSISSIEEPLIAEAEESSKDKSISSIPSISSIEEPLIAKAEESSDKSISSIEEPLIKIEESSKDKSISSVEEPLIAEAEESSNDKGISSISSIEEPLIKIEESSDKSIPTIKEQMIEEEDKEEVIESDDEEENDEEEELEHEVKNIDGMKLNKPYYFQTLIENKDPLLILKEDTPQYNSYPRTCSSNMRRQPVILTDSQLAKINTEHPGFLRDEDVIKYGSNPKNQFNYVCPRFWCLKNNTIIEPSELKEVIGKDGKTELVHPTCGKVLPHGEKKVKPGYYIYEFYKPKPGKTDYKKYPSLIPDSHPDGLCLPCCFDKYNTEGRIHAMNKCQKGTVDKNEIKEDDYIKGVDKFPLEQGRWGYLPVEIQIMLREVNADCQISKTNTNIKDNYPCLLRHGIEVTKNQSFIACIADLLFFGKKDVTNAISVKEMRERIIKSVTVDSFIKLQNGNLVTDFYDSLKQVDINKYNNTKLFSKIHMDNPEEISYYSKVISAYENFIDFLNDKDAFIDHTYLWDIISIPNKYLFPNGVNLVIFHLPKDDITNNVQLLCPTNHYSNEFYEARKPTIIIIKEDEYYEPIYSYTTNNKKILIIKEFKEYDPTLSKTMRTVFKEIIKPFFNIICRPLESMPNVYKAKRPLILYELINKLEIYDYKIKKMVLNFNNKVIGVLSEEPNSEVACFVPCFPSSLDETNNPTLDYVFMTDVTLWNTYDITVKFLNKLDNRSKKRKPEADIPCKPAFKVIEDEHIVGILTITNQFIQISQPIIASEINSKQDLPSITNNNYIVNSKSKHMIQSDVEITTQQNEVDNDRVVYIKKIRLETNFYNVFRNTIRILLNNYENSKIREKIEYELLHEYIIYSDKLENIDILLRNLVEDKIQFIGDNNYYKLINEVSTCIVKDKQSCSTTPNLCVVTENDKCNLILPEKNLITNKENESIYYGRMADELIRYNRIKSFMFQPQVYLSVGNIGYKLRETELILIQSLLTQEYFENLIPATTNKYIKHNSYDEVQPILTQVYDNTIRSLTEDKPNQLCEKIKNNHITSSIWKNAFPEDYSEIEYSKYTFCTFTFIIDLIEQKTNTKVTVNELKNELIDEYKKYLDNYIDKIVDILILEGKQSMGLKIQTDKVSFINLIYSDNYFLTTMDLWLLVIKYKIPTIFISPTLILQTNKLKHEFVGYSDDSNTFAFIILPGFRPENIPNYKLIQSNTESVFISLNKLNENSVERIRMAINNKSSVEDYLSNFVKPIKPKYIKKKPIKFIIESESPNIIIEDSSEEEFIIRSPPPIKKKKQTKKLQIKGGKTKTKRGFFTSLLG